MLSIHGLKKGRGGGAIADYAEESEAADYYGEGKKAPAAWHGTGAAALGLDGIEYDRETMIHLLEGRGPDGETLARVAENHRPGWDMTFSAPKSVSAVWAIGDDALRTEIETAHDAALAAAFAHIEADGMVIVRSGQGGVEREAAAGLTVATFRHGTSRAGDPDLHSHCLLVNLSRTRDGAWRRLDPANIFRRKIEIGAVYRAELADRMQALHFHVERDGTSFRLSDVSRDLCEKWSKRAQEIRDSLGGIEAGAIAKASAALASRGAKKIGDRDELHARWQAEAAAMGVTQASITQMTVGNRQAERTADVARQAIIDEAVKRIEGQKSVFTANELYREIAISSQCVINAADARQLMREAVASEALVQLPETRDEGGKRLPDRYTTREMLALETRLVEQAMARRNEAQHVFDEAHIASAIRETECEKEIEFSAEQRAAIEHICLGADGITAIVGVAGAGKSTALDAARRAWEAAGYRVRGAALQGRAAEALEESSGIKSDTLAMVMLRATPDRQTGIIADRLTAKDVCVLDEAGLVGSRQMAALADAAKKAGAKLVLVGHHKQYQAIEAGGAFAALARRLGAARLDDNRRQHDAEHRGAVDDILRGRTAEALAWYHQRGLLVIAEGDGVAEVAAAWRADREAGHEPLVMSARHDATRAINDAARATLAGDRSASIEIPVTDREKKPAGRRAFNVGDTIVFKKNDRRMRVRNGVKATIEAIEATAESGAIVTARLAGGRTVTVDTRVYAALDHGWAITGHSSQGLTEGRAILHIADPQMLDLHAFYVGASRAREQTRIVISRHALDDAAAAEGLDEDSPTAQLTALIKALGRVREKEFSADAFADQAAFVDLDTARIQGTIEEDVQELSV